MYFNSEVQSHIYAGFRFALKPGGYLFLGKSEMLLTRTSTFAPIDLKLRLFSRVPQPGDDAGGRGASVPRSEDAPADLFQSTVFQGATVAQIVLDASGALVAVNGLARSEFGVSEADLGRPFQDLELSFRPTELRSRIERAETERRSNIESAVQWRPRSGEDRYLDIEVVPIARRRDVPRYEHHVRRRDRVARAASGARTVAARARDRVRGDPVHGRGARDDERGAAVDERGARDDERGAAVDERGARDDERGAAVDERGARDDQYRAARANCAAQPREHVPRVSARRRAGRRRSSWTATSTSRAGMRRQKTSGDCV